MPRRVDAEALRHAVDGCIDAVVDPASWPSVLGSIGEAAGATGAVMFAFGGRDRASFLCSERCAGPMDLYLASDWCSNNPRLERAPDDRIRSDADFMVEPGQARDNRAFREDFLRKHDMGWFAGTRLFRDGERLILISVERAFHHGAFEADDLACLDRAYGAMRRIVALVPTLDSRLRSAVLEGFEAREQAAAILGHRGALLQLNPSAERILAGVLRLRHGRLNPTNYRHGAAWDGFVARLLSTAGAASVPLPLILTGQDSMSVRVRGTPLPSQADALFRGASALLFFDPLQRPPVEAATLRSVYGLTGAEARLASALSGCYDLRRASVAIGMGRETARTHLRATFAKTGAKSQSELVGMFALLR